MPLFCLRFLNDKKGRAYQGRFRVKTGFLLIFDFLFDDKLLKEHFESLEIGYNTLAAFLPITEARKTQIWAEKGLNFKCPPTIFADLSLAEFSHTHCDEAGAC